MNDEPLLQYGYRKKLAISNLMMMIGSAFPHLQYLYSYFLRRGRRRTDVADVSSVGEEGSRNVWNVHIWKTIPDKENRSSVLTIKTIEIETDRSKLQVPFTSRCLRRESRDKCGKIPMLCDEEAIRRQVLTVCGAGV